MLRTRSPQAGTALQSCDLGGQALLFPKGWGSHSQLAEGPSLPGLPLSTQSSFSPLPSPRPFPPSFPVRGPLSVKNDRSESEQVTHPAAANSPPRHLPGTSQASSSRERGLDVSEQSASQSRVAPSPAVSCPLGVQWGGGRAHPERRQLVGAPGGSWWGGPSSGQHEKHLIRELSKVPGRLRLTLLRSPGH